MGCETRGVLPCGAFHFFWEGNGVLLEAGGGWHREEFERSIRKTHFARVRDDRL